MKLILSLGALVLVGGFQNCSKATFSEAHAGSSEQLSVTGLPDTNVAISPLVCSVGQNATLTAQQVFPAPCLIDPKLPQNTLGLEMNKNYLLKPADGSANLFILDSDSALGISQDTQLYVEVATYLAPDSVVIYAVDALGNETKIVDICNIATYSKGDPSRGIARPYSDTIVQFNVVMPKGTRHLKFDFSAALTPTYVGVWGLGEFSSALFDVKTNPFPAKQANYFRPMTSLPPELNDNRDPAAGAMICK